MGTWWVQALACACLVPALSMLSCRLMHKSMRLISASAIQDMADQELWSCSAYYLGRGKPLQPRKGALIHHSYHSAVGALGALPQTLQGV